MSRTFCKWITFINDNTDPKILRAMAIIDATLFFRIGCVGDKMPPKAFEFKGSKKMVRTNAKKALKLWKDEGLRYLGHCTYPDDKLKNIDDYAGLKSGVKEYLSHQILDNIKSGDEKKTLFFWEVKSSNTSELQHCLNRTAFKEGDDMVSVSWNKQNLLVVEDYVTPFNKEASAGRFSGEFQTCQNSAETTKHGGNFLSLLLSMQADPFVTDHSVEIVICNPDGVETTQDDQILRGIWESLGISEKQEMEHLYRFGIKQRPFDWSALDSSMAINF